LLVRGDYLMKYSQNFWVKDHRQIYLLGNPLIWFLSTAAIAGYVAVRGLLILRAQRGYRDFENSEHPFHIHSMQEFNLPPLAKVVKYDMLCGFLFMGWGLHYFPFFLMSRQLFLHHYLPALYFAILLLCAVFDFMTSTLRPRWRLQIAAVLIICAVWNFSIFSPLVYGNTWTRQECEKAKWFRTWDFSWYEINNACVVVIVNLLVFLVKLSSMTCVSTLLPFANG